MDSITAICRTCLSKDRTLFPLLQLRTTILDINLNQLTDLNGGVCWECRSMLRKFQNFKSQVHKAQQLLNNARQIQDLSSLSRLQTKFLKNYDCRLKYDPLTISDEMSEITIKKEEFPIEDNDEPYSIKSDDDNEVGNHIRNERKKTKTRNKNVHEKQNDFCAVMFKEKNILKTNIKKKRGSRKKVICDNKKININDSQTDDNISESFKNLHQKTGINTIKDEIEDVDGAELYKEANKLLHRRSIDKINETTDSDDDGNVIEKFSTIVFSEEEMLRNREEKRMQPNFKKIQYKCDMCVLGFLKKENYDVHMMKKHDESVGEHECDICRVRYTNKLEVARHRSKHYMCYRCKLCKYETGQVWAVVNHCRSRHRRDTKDRIHCTQCDVIATTPEDLAEHIKTKHTLRCDECGGRFKGKHTLRTHKVRIHAVKREFICDICTKTFTKKSRLESHMVTHDSALAKQLAYCATCKIQYKNIYIYRGHLRNSTNHSERNYACAECNKKFSSRAYWIQHYNFYHLQKSQFVCQQCDKLFISDWRLKNHKQKYHGLDRPRDHQCNECGKKFFTLATLRSHQLTHSEQRTYMCEDCGDTFKQRAALYTHTRLVHQGVKRKKQ